MKVRVTTPAALGPEELAAWEHFRAASPGLASPYFAPAYTRIVGSVLDSVRVGVLEEGGEPVGFLPFQRRALGVAGPVGGRISDYQGVIHRPGLEFDAEALVRGCGLRVFEFDHLLAEQAPFARFQHARAESPQLDLSQGFASYRDWVRGESASMVQSTERKARKLARELGALRFEHASRDESVLARLLEWKSAQLRRTGLADLFRLAWPREVVTRIFHAEEPGFSGVLSVLRSRERVVAAHFGMRSGDTLHLWFPSFDPDLGAYSPGRILIWMLAESAAREGVRTLDLGKGDDPYKDRLRNAAVPLAEGAVELPSLARTLRSARRRLESRVRGNRVLHGALRPLARALRGPRGSGD